MNCKHSQEQLDASFDRGEPLSDDLQQHLETCPSCAHYQQELHDLDGLLYHTAPIEEDPALVARIQAAVVQPRTPTIPLWLGVAVTMAAVLVSFAGGWALDHYLTAPKVNLITWQSNEPLLPDWATLRREIVEIPMQLSNETTTIVTATQALMRRSDDLLADWFGSNSHLLWLGCIAGLVLVVLVDSREVRRTA